MERKDRLMEIPVKIGEFVKGERVEGFSFKISYFKNY